MHYRVYDPSRDFTFEEKLDLKKRLERRMKPADTRLLEEILLDTHRYRYKFTSDDGGVLEHATYDPIPFRTHPNRRGFDVDVSINYLPHPVLHDLHEHFVALPKEQTRRKQQSARLARQIRDTEDALRKIQGQRRS